MWRKSYAIFFSTHERQNKTHTKSRTSEAQVPLWTARATAFTCTKLAH